MCIRWTCLQSCAKKRRWQKYNMQGTSPWCNNNLRNERRFSNPIISVVFHWTLFRDTDKRWLRFTSLHRIYLLVASIYYKWRGGSGTIYTGGLVVLMVNTYSSLSVTLRHLCWFVGDLLLPLALLSSWLFTWYDSRLLVDADSLFCCLLHADALHLFCKFMFAYAYFYNYNFTR